MKITSRQWNYLGFSAVLIVAGFFRLYRLDDTLHWRGDEGRDASIMRQMIVTHHPVLIGPPTSVSTDIGSLYLGPLTYYLMAPGLWLAGGSPLGPPVVVVIFSLATAWLLWRVGRIMFHPIVGWLAAMMWVLSPNAILFGRHAWNPNFMPFFALLTIWAIWQAAVKHKTWWWVSAAASFAAAIQCHALGWALLPILILGWFVDMRRVRLAADGRQWRLFWRSSGVAAAAASLIILPLIIYDIRHGGYSWRVIMSYIQYQAGQNLGGWWPMIQRFGSQFNLSINDIFGSTRMWWGWAVLAVVTAIIISARRKIQNLEKQGLWLIGAWILCGVGALAIFNGPIFIQYREVVWPAIVLVMAWIAWRLIDGEVPVKLLPWLIAAIFLMLVIGKTYVDPTTGLPDGDYAASKHAATLIQQHSGNQLFSLGMVSDRGNSDSAYRYVLTWKGLTSVAPDQANQVFVVCENSDCTSLSPAQLQPVSWFSSQIINSWPLNPTITVFQLLKQL